MGLGLRRKTVIRALELYYQPIELKKSREAISEIQSIYPSNQDLIKKMQFKITMIEFNNTMIKEILRELLEEKKSFLYYRYNKGMNLIAIAMKLYVTVSQLQRWETEILDMVEHFVYSSYSEKMLSDDKIKLMILVLEGKIEILQRSEYERLVDYAYLEMLKEKRQFFINLLEKSEEYLKLLNQEERLILKERLSNNNLPLKQISEKYGVSNASVSIYVNKFKKYITRVECQVEE